MRTTVFVGVSLDGFLARTDHALDWLPGGDGEELGDEHGFEAFFTSVDAMLIGRNTYDVVLKFDKWPYGAKPVYVWSSRDLAPAPEGAVLERVTGDPAQMLALLDSRGHEHVYVDGGRTIQAFLRAGLIDRMVITRVPVLIGTGIPLFGPVPLDIPLSHLGTKTLSGGLVQSEYRVRDPFESP